MIRAVNFLDTTFDLINCIYKPYRKPNDIPVYINKNSIHPPTVFRQLAKSVSRRISETSSNEQIFKESIPIYEEALKKSGFHEKLEHVREEVDKHGKEEKKRRKRKIIWFSPPYSNNVKSNVRKQFLKLVRWNFPKGHKLNKIFNKNTFKASYSCMRNMSSILTSRNKKILAENEKQYECNCRNKDECPLENKCLTPRVIHEADVITSNTSRKFYIGLSDTPFKERYNNHNCDFRNRHYEKSTELSKYIFGACKKVV